ncbi:MAG TPA: hypothetical protein VI386_16260 [Candidatus Sulfotelmatobacter sp.]
MKSIQSIFMFFYVVAVTLANAQSVRTGDEVLRAMHDRYSESWYQTVTFTQKSTTYNPDGTTKVETWYEALKLPAKLRIDIGPPSSGQGYIFDNGTVTIVKDDKIAGTRADVNMLLVLGFDVYGQDSRTTIKVVKSQGYDLTKLRDDTWERHNVYVVGAEKGDLQSRQFWVDKDKLLFVREIEPAKDGSGKTEDIRFEDYHQLAGGWIAARVEVHVDNKVVFSEEYTDIQPHAKLDPEVFNPEKFKSTHWEKP